MRFLFLFFLFFGSAFADGADDGDLLLVINFPQRYDYVPNFDASILEDRLGHLRGKRMVLLGGGDRVEVEDSEISSSASLQLRKSESLRLARRRALWVRERLIALGFGKLDLQLGILTDSVDESVIWGGVVYIYSVVD